MLHCEHSREEQPHGCNQHFIHRKENSVRGFVLVSVVGMLLSQLGAAQVLYAERTPGSDFSSHLMATLKAVPDDGAIIDARNLGGEQSLSSDINIHKSNVTILLGVVRLNMGKFHIYVGPGTQNVAFVGATPFGGLTGGRTYGGTYLKFTGSGAAVSVGGPSDNTLGFSWSDITLDISGADSNALGINLARSIDLTIYRSRISGFYKPNNQVLLRLDGSGNYTGGVIESAYLMNGHVGLQLTATGERFGVNNLTVIHPHIVGMRDAGSIGVDFVQCGQDVVIGGDLENWDVAYHFGSHATEVGLYGVRYEGNNLDAKFETGSRRNDIFTPLAGTKVVDKGTHNAIVDGERLFQVAPLR